MTSKVIFGKKNTANCIGEFSGSTNTPSVTASHSGGSATICQPLRIETRVCVSYLSTCSDMLLLVCVTHASQQSFDPSDQGLPLMGRSFDTRVSISIENGLSVGLLQALATLVLVSTYIYLEKAAKLAAI